MPLSLHGFPVLLSLDIDAETMWTARDPKNAERPVVMSQGAYGWKTDVPHILALLSRRLTSGSDRRRRERGPAPCPSRAAGRRGT
jgi:hypothetical protein